MADVNTRPHRATREPPVVRLAQEHEHLHWLPRLPHTLCFGETRKVDWQATVQRGGARTRSRTSSIGEHVWVRADGEQLVVVHIDHQGPQGGRPPPVDGAGPSSYRVMRTTRRGRPARLSASLVPAALRSRRSLRSARAPSAWLIKAAAAGHARLAEDGRSIDLAKLYGTAAVNDALRVRRAPAGSPTATSPAILAHQQSHRRDPAPHARRGPLAAALDPPWEGFGR